MILVGFMFWGVAINSRMLLLGLGYLAAGLATAVTALISFGEAEAGGSVSE